jgi:hypothetical protein
MKIYMHIIFGWLRGKHSQGIDELDQAITDALEPFGFKQTSSSIDLMIRDLCFEADEIVIPAGKQDNQPKTTA